MDQTQTNEPKAKTQKRQLPSSELDFHLMTTDSRWGDQLTPELSRRLNKYFVQRDSEGKQLFDKDGNMLGSTSNLWGMLGFYTRDMRLANLSVWNGEVAYCQYFLDLANDMLQAEMIEPFIICLSRVATILELSQSKGGFLRRQMNTLRHETMTGEMDAPKKTLFGSNNKKNKHEGY